MTASPASDCVIIGPAGPKSQAIAVQRPLRRSPNDAAAHDRSVGDPLGSSCAHGAGQAQHGAFGCVRINCKLRPKPSLVWYYNNLRGQPKKNKIVSRLRGYHGCSVISGSMTGLSVFHDHMNFPFPGILHTGTPHHYWDADQGETEEFFLAGWPWSLKI